MARIHIISPLFFLFLNVLRSGLEKCERNVLPVLNNLLENREMNLEDGKFLISYKNYQKLLETHSEEELKRMGLLCTHPNFRVIALSVPVNPFSSTVSCPVFTHTCFVHTKNRLRNIREIRWTRHSEVDFKEDRLRG
jgi:hypothetical protein